MKTIVYPVLHREIVERAYPQPSQIRCWWVEMLQACGSYHAALDYALPQMRGLEAVYRAWVLSVLVEYRDEILQVVERRNSEVNCPALPGLWASASASAASAATP